MDAVIPAAGRGTRMRPATEALSKEMLPVAGKPAIQRVVEEAVQAGITEIVVVVGPEKPDIAEHLTTVDEFGSGVSFQFVVQAEPRGLGDAILQARPALEADEAFAVLYPDNLVVSDDPAIGQLLDAHRRLGASVSHVVEKGDGEIGAYSAIDGIPEDEDTYRVTGMVEKPEPGHAPSNLAPIGRHVLSSTIFDVLEQTEPGQGGEIQLTDAMSTLARTDEHYAIILDGQRLDVGNPAGHVEANVVLDILGAADPEARADELVQLVNRTRSLLPTDPEETTPR